MPSVPVQYAADHVTTLLRSFTSKTQTTGITGNPLQHNGEIDSWQITGPQILRFSKGKYVEYIYFATASIDSTTKVITFGTATRDISWKDGATVTQLTTGVKKWTAGTKIELVWSAQAAENVLLKDQDQTMSGNLSMAAQKVVDLGDFTTAQETGLPDGSIWHNTDTNTIRMKLSGNISDVGDAGTATATESAEGKVELATAAEHTSGTTGARVVQAKNTRKTSAGAGDENMLPVLNAAGVVDVSMAGTGVRNPTAGSLYVGAGSSPMTEVAPGTTGNVLTSNGSTWQSTAPAAPKKTSDVVHASGASSTALTNPTSMTVFDTHAFTIPANDLVAGVVYQVEGWILVDKGTSSTFTVGLLAAGFAAATLAATGTDSYVHVRGWVAGTAAAGGSVNVRFFTELVQGDNSGAPLGSPVSYYQQSPIATNATIALALGAFFGTSNASHSTSLLGAVYTKVSATPF